MTEPELNEADAEIERMARRLSNWGRWGEEDELGTLNLVTPERRLAAAGAIRRGETFSLALPLDRQGPQPPFERRLNPQHVMLQTGTELRAGVQRGAIGGWGYADDMVTMALQCGTHWDGLAHAFHDYAMYNGRDCALVGVDGAKRNDIRAMSDAVATRAVLCDVPRALGVEALDTDHRITVAELELTLERQRVEIEEGDALLLRTGHLARARAQGGWDGYTYADEPGIGLDALPWVSQLGIAAIATDTWAFEVLPSGGAIMLPVHAVGIVHMGLLLGEMFDLEALADDCASDGVYEMAFVAPPLPFTGAVGSPVNPIVVK